MRRILRVLGNLFSLQHQVFRLMLQTVPSDPAFVPSRGRAQPLPA
jgi:hypothetical protein